MREKETVSTNWCDLSCTYTKWPLADGSERTIGGIETCDYDTPPEGLEDPTLSLTEQVDYYEILNYWLIDSR